jgi:hypothetical protein
MKTNWNVVAARVNAAAGVVASYAGLTGLVPAKTAGATVLVMLVIQALLKPAQDPHREPPPAD